MPKQEQEMSTNAELIEAIYAAFARGDASFIASHTAEDARWDFNVAASDVPWHQPVVGPREVPGFLDAFVSNIDLEAFEPRKFIATGDDVIVHLGLAYTIKRTGKRVREEQLQWWTVRDGKVAGLRHFEDTAQVLAAWRSDH
jgi:ketosteroid isomerase-like protein